TSFSGLNTKGIIVSSNGLSSNRREPGRSAHIGSMFRTTLTTTAPSPTQGSPAVGTAKSWNMSMTYFNFESALTMVMVKSSAPLLVEGSRYTNEHRRHPRVVRNNECARAGIPPAPPDRQIH